MVLNIAETTSFSSPVRPSWRLTSSASPPFGRGGLPVVVQKRCCPAQLPAGIRDGFGTTGKEHEYVRIVRLSAKIAVTSRLKQHTLRQ